MRMYLKKIRMGLTNNLKITILLMKNYCRIRKNIGEGNRAILLPKSKEEELPI